MGGNYDKNEKKCKSYPIPDSRLGNSSQLSSYNFISNTGSIGVLSHPTNMDMVM